MIKSDQDDKVKVISQALPWHQDRLHELLLQLDRLPHALLISGAPGIGKSVFADALAAALLCEANRAPGALACGACSACGWLAAGSHPDLRRLSRQVDDDGKVSADIRIEQFRSLAEFLVVGAHRGARRVVVIDPADAMNTVTANALLKTLEEPGSGLCFILVSSRVDALPATIRSRCQVRSLPSPGVPEALAYIHGATGCSPQDAQAWLAMAGGAPLPAVHFAEPARAAAHRAMLEALARLPDTEAVDVADALQSHEARLWLPLMQRWLMDIARIREGAAPRYFPQSSARLQELAARSSSSGLVRAARQLAAQFRLVGHPLNPRLFCEESLGALTLAFGPHEAGERTP